MKEKVFEIWTKITEWLKTRRGQVIVLVGLLVVLGSTAIYALTQTQSETKSVQPTQTTTTTTTVANAEVDNINKQLEEVTKDTDVEALVATINALTDEKQKSELLAKVETVKTKVAELKQEAEATQKSEETTQAVASNDSSSSTDSSSGTSNGNGSSSNASNSSSTNHYSSNNSSSSSSSNNSQPSTPVTPATQAPTTVAPTTQAPQTQKYRLNRLGNTGMEFATEAEASAWLHKMMDESIDALERGDQNWAYTGRYHNLAWSDGSYTWTVDLFKQ